MQFVCWTYSEPSGLAGGFWPLEDQSPASESPPPTLPSAPARNRDHATSYAARNRDHATSYAARSCTKQRPHHELRCKKLHETETTPRVTLQEAARNRDHTTSYAARSCTKQRPRHELRCKKLHETETTPRVMLQETITRSYVRILKETSIRQHTFCELNISQVYLEMRKRLQYSAVPILENTHNSDD